MTMSFPRPSACETPVYTARPRMHRAVYLFTSYLSLVVIAPTLEGWPARWLVTYPYALCRRTPIQELTGPGVD